MLASGVARRGAALKLVVPAGILFFVFLIGLGIVGGIAGSSQASAASCGGAGQPDAEYESGGDSTSTDSTDGLHAQQVKNATIIDAEAVKAKLSGRATLIALMTGLQESTLLNLDHGDLDSVGVFQQRPSSGWGTKEQIMNVSYSARMFFLGGDGGDPPGLTDIGGWERMDLGTAAQKVQRSAYPTLYSGQESEARRIAKEAGINLNRSGAASTQPSGTPSGDTTAPSDAPSGAPTERCKNEGDQQGIPAKPGTAFHDSQAAWPAEVKNRRSTAEAVAWARKQAETGTTGWYRKCLRFVGLAYGWNSTEVYAVDQYYVAPASMRHNGDRNPPLGALLYWRTDSRAGHVAIYVGNGEIASNDIREPGKISVVPASDIESKWGATYLGWAPPFFPTSG